jgi:hypothetical protein
MVTRATSLETQDKISSSTYRLDAAPICPARLHCGNSATHQEPAGHPLAIFEGFAKSYYILPNLMNSKFEGNGCPDGAWIIACEQGTYKDVLLYMPPDTSKYPVAEFKAAN